MRKDYGCINYKTTPSYAKTSTITVWRRYDKTAVQININKKGNVPSITGLTPKKCCSEHRRSACAVDDAGNFPGLPEKRLGLILTPGKIGFGSYGGINSNVRNRSALMHLLTKLMDATVLLDEVRVTVRSEVKSRLYTRGVKRRFWTVDQIALSRR